MLIVIFTHGSILVLGQIILLKKELAEAIRAIQGFGYGDLADIWVQNSIGDLERARQSITIDKLTDPSKALQFDHIAMLSHCVSIQNDVFTEAVSVCSGQQYIAIGSSNPEIGWTNPEKMGRT